MTRMPNPKIERTTIRGSHASSLMPSELVKWGGERPGGAPTPPATALPTREVRA
jgi:hypothetical protein